VIVDFNARRRAMPTHRTTPLLGVAVGTLLAATGCAEVPSMEADHPSIDRLLLSSDEKTCTCGDYVLVEGCTVTFTMPFESLRPNSNDPNGSAFAARVSLGGVHDSVKDTLYEVSGKVSGGKVEFDWTVEFEQPTGERLTSLQQGSGLKGSLQVEAAQGYFDYNLSFATPPSDSTPRIICAYAAEKDGMPVREGFPSSGDGTFQLITRFFNPVTEVHAVSYSIYEADALIHDPVIEDIAVDKILDDGLEARYTWLAGGGGEGWSIQGSAEYFFTVQVTDATTGETVSSSGSREFH
jgi:hypothetical protein